MCKPGLAFGVGLSAVNQLQQPPEDLAADLGGAAMSHFNCDVLSAPRQRSLLRRTFFALG